MSSSGMLLLLSALLLHSARDGSAGNSTGKINGTSCHRENSENCCLEQTDAWANDSLQALLKKVHDFVCQHRSVNSTCVCVGLLASQAPPSPNDTGLAVVTLCDVNASFTVFSKDCCCTVPGCRNATEGDGLKELLEKVWMILKQPEVIAAFLTGLLLSAFVCFLGRKCHRKKARGSGNKADGVATSQVVPLTDGQSAGNGFGEGEAGAAGHSAMEPREVEYSDIDFSRWNRNSPTGAEHAQAAAETEYAELQKDENGQEPEENSGDSDEDVAVAIDEEETEQ